MSFKTYLSEAKKHGEQIMDWFALHRIPVSPKFFEELFGEQEIYCFQAMEPNRIPSAIRMQGKRKQVSTFTEYSTSNIFWGATGMDWKFSYSGNATVIGIFKGKYSIKSTSDLWTHYSKGGRRWIDIKSLNTTQTELSKLMKKISREIGKEVIKELKKQKFNCLKYKIMEDNIYGDRAMPVVYNNSEYRLYARMEKNLDYNEMCSEKEFNKEKQKFIKIYFDTTYKILKKYKYEIKAYGKGLGNYTDYNEVLCYDYKIEKFIIYAEDNNGITDFEADFENEIRIMEKTGIDFMYTTNISGIKKELKQYQEKNKDLS